MTFKLQYNMNRKTKPVTRQQVKQMIVGRLEDKIASASSTGVVGTAGSVVYLSSIAQGDSLGDRAGNAIRPSLLDIRFSYIDVASGFARVIVFQDSENVGTIPTVAQVLTSASWNAVPDPTQIAMRRYKFLYDHTFPLSAVGDLTGFEHRKIKMKGPIHFVSSGGTSTSGGRNALFLLVIASTVTASVDIKSNLHYIDA
jgi:hypothetical protein